MHKEEENGGRKRNRKLVKGKRSEKSEMKAVGGPLLCVGDLLSDLNEEEEADSVTTPHHSSPSASSSSFPDSNNTHQSRDLIKLFQENYSQLNRALGGTDYSWTAHTLKLCASVETANKLVQSTNSNVTLLSHKLGELEKIVKRGDSAVAAAKALHASLNQKPPPPSSASQNI